MQSLKSLALFLPLAVYMAFVVPRLHRPTGPPPQFAVNWSRTRRLTFFWAVVTATLVVVIPAFCVFIIGALGPGACPGRVTDPWQCSSLARWIFIYFWWLIGIPLGVIGAGALSRIAFAQKTSSVEPDA
jgi:heme/copper-type cytochrome/quinol oxidase subunit 2